MTSLIANIKLTRGEEIDLPGSPISVNPLAFNEPLELGMLAMTTDSARLFIGHIPKVGDVNYNRTSFPYQNIEILTESSPRTRELFSLFNRNQHENDFYIPTTIAGGVANADITYPGYSGNQIPSRFDGSNVSVVVEYHIFDVATGAPVQNGELRILTNSFGSDLSVSRVVNGGFSEVLFDLSNYSGYSVLNCSNENGPLKFFMRKVTLQGVTNGGLVNDAGI